jgi:hypothetical protein
MPAPPCEYSYLNSLSHKVNLRIALLTALALLIAQLGAQAHAYSHLRAGSHTAEQQDLHGGQCYDCLSFAPLLASAGGPSHVLIVAAQGVEAAPDAAVVTLTTSTPTHAFRSRAPPSTH